MEGPVEKMHVNELKKTSPQQECETSRKVSQDGSRFYLSLRE